MSSESNRLTLDTYEAHVQEYVDGTTHEMSDAVKDWVDESLRRIRKNGSILELGSAFGRDADYIESKGFHIDRTDATKAFVELLRGKNQRAEVLDAIHDDFFGKHDAVFANAVLLHFTLEEAQKVISKVYDHLSDDGVFIFSLKQGDGESWSSEKVGAPRYFRLWRPQEVQTTLSSIGFRDISISPTDEPAAKWLHVIAQK
jgi:SAM-dependent methyltransferase